MHRNSEMVFGKSTGGKVSIKATEISCHEWQHQFATLEACLKHSRQISPELSGRLGSGKSSGYSRHCIFRWGIYGSGSHKMLALCSHLFVSQALAVGHIVDFYYALLPVCRPRPMRRSRRFPSEDLISSSSCSSGKTLFFVFSGSRNTAKVSIVGN